MDEFTVVIKNMERTDANGISAEVVFDDGIMIITADVVAEASADTRLQDIELAILESAQRAFADIAAFSPRQLQERLEKRLEAAQIAAARAVVDE